MPNNKSSKLDHDRGGYNPRPAHGEKQEQVGPVPTSGEPQAAHQDKKKKPGPGPGNK